MRVAVIGAGWSGLAAAVTATQDGHAVAVFEAARVLGGRARALPLRLPDGTPATLDNGQHILIGAYTQTLELMRCVGVQAHTALLRLPLTLRFPDGGGLQLPYWPAPWDAIGGILVARGWSIAEKLSLLRLAIGWRLRGFRCAPDLTVAALCARASPRVMQELVEPLCVSALNLPAREASAELFLRVVRDALFGGRGGSNLLLPRVDLAQLFPLAAQLWLTRHGGVVQTATRVVELQFAAGNWQVLGQQFDRVILATPAAAAMQLLGATQSHTPHPVAAQIGAWIGIAATLQHTAITTVYAQASGARLAQPMLALRGTSGPAQFVFDRGQLGGPRGLLAFVISSSQLDQATAQQQVVQQASVALGLEVNPVQTVVEKRAAFACPPGVQRPPMQIAPGLLACGDYVDGPYPSTLEGATRSGVAAIRSSDSGT